MSIPPYLSLLLLLGVGLLGRAPAQDAAAAVPIYAKVNLINALPGEVRLSLDGELLSEEWLQPGESTGNWPIVAGGHEVEARWGNGEDEALVTRIRAEAGEVTRLVAFLEYERDEETGEILPVPTARQLDVVPSEEFRLTLLSVSRRPEAEMEVNGKLFLVPRLEPEQVEEWRGGALLLRSRGELLGMYEFEEPGAFLCLLFDGPEGGHRVLFIRIMG